jgi:hypothetical protein
MNRRKETKGKECRNEGKGLCWSTNQAEALYLSHPLVWFVDLQNNARRVFVCVCGTVKGTLGNQPQKQMDSGKRPKKRRATRTGWPSYDLSFSQSYEVKP